MSVCPTKEWTGCFSSNWCSWFCFFTTPDLLFTMTPVLLPPVALLFSDHKYMLFSMCLKCDIATVTMPFPNGWALKNKNWKVKSNFIHKTLKMPNIQNIAFWHYIWRLTSTITFWVNEKRFNDQVAHLNRLSEIYTKYAYVCIFFITRQLVIGKKVSGWNKQDKTINFEQSFVTWRLACTWKLAF